MPHDVFISYTRADGPAARAAYDALKREGVSCWMAPQDIPPGSDWAEAIVGAIHRAKLLVLIFSRSANASEDVANEVNLARGRKLPIVWLRVEDADPTGNLEYHLRRWQWLDAFPPPVEEHLPSLCASVRQILSGASATRQDVPPGGSTGETESLRRRKDSSPERPRRFGGRAAVSLAVGLLASAVVIGFILYGQRRGDETHPPLNDNSPVGGATMTPTPTTTREPPSHAAIQAVDVIFHTLENAKNIGEGVQVNIFDRRSRRVVSEKPDAVYGKDEEWGKNSTQPAIHLIVYPAVPLAACDQLSIVVQKEPRVHRWITAVEVVGKLDTGDYKTLLDTRRAPAINLSGDHSREEISFTCK